MMRVALASASLAGLAGAFTLTRPQFAPRAVRDTRNAGGGVRMIGNLLDMLNGGSVTSRVFFQNVLSVAKFHGLQILEPLLSS